MAHPDKCEKACPRKYDNIDPITSTYNSLIDKMKHSLYNTLCWQTADSQDSVTRPRSTRARLNPTEFLANKEAIYNVVKKCGDNVVKKCGDYLKESRVQRETSKTSGSKQRKRYTCSRAGSRDPCKFNENDNVKMDDSYKKYEEKYRMRNISGKNCERICKEAAMLAERKKQISRLNLKNGYGEGEKKWRSHTRNKQSDNMMKRVQTQHRCAGKKCKQIYELSEEQCRNFKEKGYVKVNVRVKPNISVSDFDIIIRRDKIKYPGSEE